MSYSVEKFEPVKVLDTRIDLAEAPVYAVLQGGAKHTVQAYQPSASSSTQLTFNVTTPSPAVVVSRKMMLKTTITLSITGKALAANAACISVGSTDAARNFPIASCTDQLTLSINNTAMSVPLREVFGAMKWIQGDKLMTLCDEVPSYFDNAQKYSDFVSSNRNALGGAYTSNTEYTRGAFPYNVTTYYGGAVYNASTNTWASGATVTSVVSFQVCEPIFISPLQWAQVSQGMIGVQNMSLNLQLSNIARMWSSAQSTSSNGLTVTPGAVTTSIVPSTANASLFGNPLLYLEYITPPITEAMPKQVSLPYHVVQPYITASADTFLATPSPYVPTAPLTKAIQSQSIQLQSVPQYAIIYARRQTANETYATPDAFLGLRGVSITFNNQTGLLSTAQPEHLYSMSRKNGVTQTWLEWSGRGFAGIAASSGANQVPVGLVGSVCVLEFGTDIPIDDSLAPGVAGTFQFSANATFENTGSDDLATPALYVVFVHEGILTVGEGRAYAQVGVVSAADVLDAKTAPTINQAALMESGGNFYSSMAEKIRKHLQFKPKGAGLVYPKGDAGKLGGALLGRAQLKARLA